jgi:hypothetical protein
MDTEIRQTLPYARPADIFEFYSLHLGCKQGKIGNAQLLECLGPQSTLQPTTIPVRLLSPVALLPTLYRCRHELVPIPPITPATWAPIQHCACLPDPISHTPETRLVASCFHQYRLSQLSVPHGLCSQKAAPTRWSQPRSCSWR